MNKKKILDVLLGICIGALIFMIIIGIGGCGRIKEVDYSSIIPDPKASFSGADISIVDGDGGTMYAFNITDYADGQYEEFVQGCQTMGFSDISYYTVNEVTGIDFGAYTDNGKYWVRVNLDSINNIIYVICQTATQSED
jgi:hypothetical protein